MKKLNSSQFLSTVIAVILGIWIGRNSDKIKEFVLSNPLLSSASCQYDGKKYKNGDSFRSTDGCNTCGCNNGQVACTLMACER